MHSNRLPLAAGGIALGMLMPAQAQAQKFTVSCEAASLAAYDKGADKPYELLRVQRFVVTVDVEAKSCAVESAEANYLKGRNQPQVLKSDPAAAKCTLRVTDKGRAFMNGRAHLKGEARAVTPILTINYEVHKTPPAAGSTESKGEYFVISGFPSLKAKGGKVENRIKAGCVQSKPGA